MKKVLEKKKMISLLWLTLLYTFPFSENSSLRAIEHDEDYITSFKFALPVASMNII